MADIIDQDAGSELFASYEAELNIVKADLNQKLEHIPELTGEPRKAAVGQAQRAVEEAKEIVDSPFACKTLLMEPARPNAYREAKHSRKPQVQSQLSVS
jgi:vesicle transport through interaction with t-SNAREs protein 1